MRTSYPAIFYEEAIGYVVVFPDLDYLSTYGVTFEEAFMMAKECLVGYLYNARKEHETLPLPLMVSKIDPVNISKILGFEPKGFFIQLITVDVDEFIEKFME